MKFPCVEELDRLKRSSLAGERSAESLAQRHRRVKERPGFPSLEDSANLPAADIIAAEIVEGLEAALQQSAAIAADLKK